MKRSKKISVVMYNLLVENKMDGFSVVEIRDASLKIEGVASDLDEARKQVYRQLLRFEKNGWLASKGSGRNKKYFQTETFKSMTVEPRAKYIQVAIENSSSRDYSILEKERNQYQGELEITFGEIEEYQSMISRFPELEDTLSVMYQKTRSRSAILLGKVNVLTNVIDTIEREH